MSRLLNSILKYFNIIIIYRDGKAIGDQLCMSAIIKLIYEQKGKKIIIFSNYPQIFKHNPRVLKSLDISKHKLLFRVIRRLNGSSIKNFLFNGNYEEYMYTSKSRFHLVEAHSQNFNMDLDYTKLQCEIYFSKKELEGFKKKFDLPKDYVVVQPVGKVTYTPNKEWGYKNYQNVINNLNESWVQVGLSEDMLLDNVVDYRGKTSLRELFYIIFNAKFVLANEGLLNHIASSFNTKSFVLFSGFSNIELAKYSNTVAIYETKNIECRPCWKLDECDVENKPCMENITYEQVIKIIKKESFETYIHN